jgi:hypothetical protein
MMWRRLLTARLAWLAWLAWLACLLRHQLRARQLHGHAHVLTSHEWLAAT